MPRLRLVVPLFVLDFLCIHPFQNGNGRVSRLAALRLLYHAGYDVGRYISLERIVQESREFLLRDLGGQLAGVARRPPRRDALGRILLGGPAQRLPTVRGAYGQYSTDEQRRQAGCIGGRNTWIAALRQTDKSAPPLFFKILRASRLPAPSGGLQDQQGRLRRLVHRTPESATRVRHDGHVRSGPEKARHLRGVVELQAGEA